MRGKHCKLVIANCKLQIGSRPPSICNLQFTRVRNPVSSRNRVSGQRPSARGGMTLLEILVALAIFLAAVAVIGQLVGTGSQAATGAQLKSEAARRCETVMAEAVAGVIPLQSTGDTSFEDDQQWTWSLTVTDAAHADMLQVETIVTRKNRQGEAQVSFNLVRWIRDPELWLQSTVGSGTTTATGGSL